MSERIPITRPIIGSEEQHAVAQVLASGFLVQGPKVAEFERMVAELVGVDHAVAVTNCTAALHLSLLALGVGAGDVVVVAPYSWVATANVIELCGATPRFVDIDPCTFNMSAAQLRDTLERAALVGERIAAIMPVHTFGNPAGISELAQIAADHGVPLIEDAACALGAVEAEMSAGSFGLMSCFSFHPRKIITTGEGGMLITSDERLASFARTYRNHGQEAHDGVVEFVAPGGNLRLTEMQGALGVEQMHRLAGLVAARGQLAAGYDEAVSALGCVPQRRAGGAAVQSYVCLVPDGFDAADVIAALRASDVEATIGTNAIPYTKYYRERYGCSDSDLPVTATVRDRAVTLPLFPGMTDRQQRRVIDELAKAVT